MRLSFIDLLYSLSDALDCVERQLCGIAEQHARRTACLCVMMGKTLSYTADQLADLAGCAILHDNALTEYITEELEHGRDVVLQTEYVKAGRHCVMGEQNMEGFPFKTDVAGAILYHHEAADGTGPFQKNAEETPLYAQLIHIADQIDVRFNLFQGTGGKYQQVIDYIKKQAGLQFSEQCVELFLDSVTEEAFTNLYGDGAGKLLLSMLPDCTREYNNQEVYAFCSLFAKIVDYKSGFTKRHSVGIAEKAAEMGRFYHCGEEMVTKLYFAGALHDIGKLVIDNDVLEKPDKLTDQEFSYMKNHAWYTYQMLNRIHGIEDITSWASMHHEKLNGKGYPFGKTGEELGFYERLLACIDIYQALTEERPYKQGFTHKKSMEIMKQMVGDGFIDGSITNDIDAAFGTSEE